jgi:hypothetical protein
MDSPTSVRLNNSAPIIVCLHCRCHSLQSSFASILWNCVPDWRLVRSNQSTIWNISDVSVPYFGWKFYFYSTENLQQSTSSANHSISRWKWKMKNWFVTDEIIKRVLKMNQQQHQAITAIQSKETYEMFTSDRDQQIRKSLNLWKPKRVNSAGWKSIIPLQASTELKIFGLKAKFIFITALKLPVNRVGRFCYQTIIN